MSEKPKAQVVITAPEPVKGGSFTEALVGSFQRLNPVLDYYNAADREVDRLLFNGLIRFEGNGLPVTDLAETYGISQDGTIYNFTLRSGVKWHDGKSLTADDVLFTIDLMRNGEDIVPLDLQNFWKDIEVKKFNDTTLQFRLPEAFSPFLDYLTFGILPKHLLAEYSMKNIVDAPFNMKPVGTGPYRFQRFIVENNQVTGVVLAANPNYFGQKPFIQDVIFRYYPDAGGALKAYQQGDVQAIGKVTTEILPAVLAQKNLAIYSSRRPEMTMILFNLKNSNLTFLQDVVVRKALLTGLNRQWIVDRVLKSQAVVSNGPVLPGTWAYYEPNEKLVFDPEAARNALRDAGYVLENDKAPVRKKDNVALVIRLSLPDDDVHKAIGEAIAKDWAALNIQVDLEPLPYDQLVKERLETRSFQAALVELNLSRSPDPDPYPFWDQGQVSGGQNYGQWDNRIASEYLEQARVTIDFNERARLYRNFQVVFRQEMPAIPLYYPIYTYAISNQVQGVRVGLLFDSADRFNTIVEWYLATQNPKETPIVRTTLTP
ncbi:MAG TPA: peptide ABC transporter substrate-binding protein [Anaerolineaceae bacterium]